MSLASLAVSPGTFTIQCHGGLDVLSRLILSHIWNLAKPSISKPEVGLLVRLRADIMIHHGHANSCACAIVHAI
jgi:hypothetical protein